MVEASKNTAQKLQNYQCALEEEQRMKNQIAQFSGSLDTPQGKALQSSYRQAKARVKKAQLM